MDEKLINGLLQRLDTLTAKLGVGADALWAIFVRQAFISSLVDLCIYALIITAWPLWWKLVQKARTIPKENYDDDNRHFALIGCGILMVLLGILSILAICSISDTVSGVVNPEYWAFQHLIRR